MNGSLWQGSGMTEDEYNDMRMILFGDRALSDWTDDQLADKQKFVHSAIQDAYDGGWLDLDKEKAYGNASIVFDRELEEYRREQME